MITSGKVVDLSYSLKNAEGEVLDQADAKDPFTYLHGAEQVVPGLEAALEGLKVGDKKNVVVPPEEGYGLQDPKLKVIAKRSDFPKEVELEEGMEFEATAPNGDEIIFTVESLEGDKVYVNGNHPLAGQTLHFDVEVLKVRDATDEEIEHGHAHGPHGHGHDHHH